MASGNRWVLDAGVWLFLGTLGGRDLPFLLGGEASVCVSDGFHLKELCLKSGRLHLSAL